MSEYNVELQDGIVLGGGGSSDIAWLPSVDESGDLSWTRSTTKTPPETVNIKGAPGADGQDGAPGQDGTDGTDGRGVTSVAVNASNHVIVTYSDSTSSDAGAVDVTVPIDDTTAANNKVYSSAKVENELSEKVDEDDLFVPAANIFDPSHDVVDGVYINTTGGYKSGSGYAVFVVPVQGNTKYTFSKYYYSFAFYDENGTLIGSVHVESGWHDATTATAPNNAKTLKISVKTNVDLSEYMVVKGESLPSTFIPYGTKEFDATLLNSQSGKTVINGLTNLICCWGDSVTEGKDMVDAHQAIYGGTTYPSQLLTMIIDSGRLIGVKNYGHGGEKTTDIIARMGLGVYLTEDLTIDANNNPVSVVSKMQSPYDNTTVLFKQESHDTNPVYVDGVKCTMTITSQGATETLVKAVNDGVSTTLREGSLVLTSNNRNASINLVYMGCNDENDVTMAMFTERADAIIKNFPKCLIIGGSSSTFWTKRGVTRENYVATMRKNYGAKFLDLYDVLTDQRGIDIALAGGYLSGRTAEEITADNDAISAHKTPPSLTEDGTAGNVHLSAAGYYVFAKLVFDRLIQLGYLD